MPEMFSTLVGSCFQQPSLTRLGKHCLISRSVGLLGKNTLSLRIWQAVYVSYVSSVPFRTCLRARAALNVAREYLKVWLLAAFMCSMHCPSITCITNVGPPLTCRRSDEHGGGWLMGCVGVCVAGVASWAVDVAYGSLVVP